MIAAKHLNRDRSGIGRSGEVGADRPKRLRLMLILLWCFTLFGLLNPSAVGNASADALKFCGERLIPSLFPLAAAGSILAQAGMGRRTSERFGRIFGWLSLSPASIVCVLMGLFAGFPTGAIIASTLVGSGQIDSEEGARLCCFTNNASAAFLVGAVGKGLFGDSRIGWLLWTAQSMAALTVGVFMGRKAMKTRPKAEEQSLPDSAPLGWGTVSRSIASSAQGMLSLAGFVVFFSALTAFAGEGIGILTARLGMNADTAALIGTAVNGFFEISGGMSRAAALELPKFAQVMLASAVTGWSGLSVYMQVLAAAKGLSDAQTAALPKRLAKAKAASALLTVGYAGVLYGVVMR